jgi:hypothetical protein
MRREAKIIVRREINDPLAVKRAERGLLIVKHAQLEMRSFGFQVSQLIG